MATINIVCDDYGWVYDQFITQFQKYSKHTILRNSKGDLNHYLPYYLVPDKITGRATAWFSHQETKNPLKSKFISAAKKVNMAISHSRKYADLLKQSGVKNIKQIMPGIDLELFKQRSPERAKNDKLVVGFVGRREYTSGRKNNKLLDEISKLSFVDFRATDGKVKMDEMPKFYADCDAIVQAALVEGGSMAVEETLAVGCPIILYNGVGVANEFSEGVIKVPFNDSKDFISRLDIMFRTKSYLEYREGYMLRAMRKQVEPYTIEMFVMKHDSIWSKIINESR